MCQSSGTCVYLFSCCLQVVGNLYPRSLKIFLPISRVIIFKVATRQAWTTNWLNIKFLRKLQAQITSVLNTFADFTPVSHRRLASRTLPSSQVARKTTLALQYRLLDIIVGFNFYRESTFKRTNVCLLGGLATITRRERWDSLKTRILSPSPSPSFLKSLALMKYK